MSSQSAATNDPFTDAAAVAHNDANASIDVSLPVGNGASLTLGANEIHVDDDDYDDSTRTKLCGLIAPSESDRKISYYHVLDASIAENVVTIKYLRAKSPKKNARLFVRTMSYPTASQDHARRWIERLLDKAYGSAQRHKKIKVLVNPFGGTGNAAKIFAKNIAPIFEAGGCQVDVQMTSHMGHAIEIARELDIDKYDLLACASGDGLPMECFNGLAQKPNAAEALRKIAVVQLPCGTGNAMSWNLNGTDEPTLAALCIVKGIRTSLDLASITQGDKRTLSFLSQSLGIVAESDLGTDNIRWMGAFRFTYGFLVRLLGKTVYPIDYAVKTEIESKEEIKRHYAREMDKRKRSDMPKDSSRTKEQEAQFGPGLPPLKYGTVNDPLPKDEDSGWTQLQSYPNLGNFYCGNMCWMAPDAPFFPASLPNDGMMDLINIDGDISRLKALKLLLSVGNGTFFDDDVVTVRKITAVRVIPRFGRPMAQATDQDQTAAGVSTTTAQPPTKMPKALKKLTGSSQKTGYFSVDGEKLPFEPFQVEIHQGLGTVLSRKADLYEYEGPKGWRDFTNQQTNVSGSTNA